ncbi:hypothetical protein M0R01_01055 [bacterium]|nr:hypothetical protein [bacterium]
MENEYKKLFNSLVDKNPSDKLFEKIILRIGKEEKMQKVKRRIAVFSLFLVISFFGFIYSFVMVQNALISSGFAQFFSLIFSDYNIITAYWQNFVFTLLESLPVFALVVSLSMFSIVLGLFAFLVKDIKFISSNNLIDKKHGF